MIPASYFFKDAYRRQWLEPESKRRQRGVIRRGLAVLIRGLARAK